MPSQTHPVFGGSTAFGLLDSFGRRSPVAATEVGVDVILRHRRQLYC
jgi:hypothetical protein